MGTISRYGLNERCTKRGPLTPTRASEVLTILHPDHKGHHPRAERRHARRDLRHHARWCRRNVPPAHRTSVTQLLIRLDRSLP